MPVRSLIEHMRILIFCYPKRRKSEKGMMKHMIKIAVCDDDENVREQITEWVREEFPCEIEGFCTGEELLKEKQTFDIIFLDISLGKLNGIETAKKIREYSNGRIIFVTACKEYVFEAFDVEAFHYLLKPLSKEKFKQVLKKAYEETKKEKAQDFYMVKIGTSYKKVPLLSILYGESNGRKIILHTKKETLEFYEKMDNLQGQLGTGFYRCHRSYLVNLGEIEGYDNSSIILKNGERIFLSKQKYPEFVACYMEYLKR